MIALENLFNPAIEIKSQSFFTESIAMIDDFLPSSAEISIRLQLSHTMINYDEAQTVVVSGLRSPIVHSLRGSEAVPLLRFGEFSGSIWNDSLFCSAC